MSKYTCCQGYMDGFVPCLNAGRCGEASCPNLCLCVEVSHHIELSLARGLLIGSRSLMCCCVHPSY